MSKCSVLSTRKSKLSYWTLLRPKYWAWTGGARSDECQRDEPDGAVAAAAGGQHIPLQRGCSSGRPTVAVTYHTRRCRKHRIPAIGDSVRLHLNSVTRTTQEVTRQCRTGHRARTPRLPEPADGPSRLGRSTGRRCSRQPPPDTHVVSSASRGGAGSARLAPLAGHDARQPLAAPGDDSWNILGLPLLARQPDRREPQPLPTRVEHEAGLPSTPDLLPTTMHECWSSYSPRLVDGGTAPARKCEGRASG